MRDDVSKLPIPASAKAYSRRHGMPALKRQPQQFIRMVGDTLNQSPHGFKNKNPEEKVQHAIKEGWSAVQIALHLID